MDLDDELNITDETTLQPEKGPGWNELRRADVAFVLDCTDTMKFALDAIKEMIVILAKKYEQANVKIRLALTEFRDQTWHNDVRKKRHVMHQHMFEDSYLTEDIQEFKKVVDSLKALGGGNLPESCYDAIVNTAENLDWGEGCQKVIVFFSDAKPLLRDQVVLNGKEETAERLMNAKIDQLHLVIDKDNHEHYYDQLLEIPNPSNEDDQIVGEAYNIKRKSRSLGIKEDNSEEAQVANFEELLKVLSTIVSTSISSIKGSHQGNRFYKKGGVSGKRRKRVKKETTGNQKKTNSGSRFRKSK